MINITFSAYQMIVDNKLPNKKFFSDLRNEIDSHSGRNSMKSPNGDIHAYVKKDLLFENDYFYLNFKIGSNGNYEPFVIDTVNDNTQKPNPKKSEEIEPNEESYIFYDFKKEIIYISSSSKSAFEKLLHFYFLDKIIVIKKLFKSYDEFIKGLRELVEIRLTTYDNNVFANVSGYTGLMKDIYGFDDPDSFELKALFNKKVLKEKDFNLLNKIKQRFDEHEFEKFVVVGNDVDEIERRFSADRFQEKFQIEVKDEGKNREIIINEILRKIRK